MGRRLQLLFPGNHNSASAIGADLESIVRYVNSAELGNRTLRELLLALFDEDGQLVAPVELRHDPAAGLQYRVGSYVDPEEGWQTIAAVSDIRGLPAADLGTVGAPLLSGRQDITATGGQTVFSYPHESTDEIVVYQNGVLLSASAHSSDAAADTVTLDTGATNGDRITIYRAQAPNVSGYERTDIVSGDSQVVFPFVHTDGEEFLVYRNGILQREGGAYDYVANAATDTITFTSSLSTGDIVSIMRVNDTSQTRVSGLMTEDKYTDGEGAIPYALLAVADGQIPAVKVSGMPGLLADRGRMYVDSEAPTGVNAGDMWIDTSIAPNILKFYNGSGWIAVSPEKGIPIFDEANAFMFLRANSTGTALEFADVDLSHLIPKTWRGAADGVATLDDTGRIPPYQLPDTYATRSFFKEHSGSVTDGNDITVTRAYKQRVRLDAIAARLGAGTCDLEIFVGGVATSATIVDVDTTLKEQNLTASVDVDARVTSREISVRVTNATGASDLEVTIAAVVTNV